MRAIGVDETPAFTIAAIIAMGIVPFTVAFLAARRRQAESLRQPPQALPAAGWYTDPTGRHVKRWWTGTAWSDHVADHERP